MLAVMRAWGAMSITEKAYEFQVLMGALGIELFPAPIPHLIQAKLRDAAPSENPYVEERRQKFVGLPVKQFEAVFIEAMNPMRMSEGLDLSAFGPKGGVGWAFGAALVDESDPPAKYLRYFEAEGYTGKDALFMARFFNQMIQRTDERFRSESERSEIGPGPKSERNRRWFKFMHDELRAQGKA